MLAQESRHWLTRSPAHPEGGWLTMLAQESRHWLTRSPAPEGGAFTTRGSGNLAFTTIIIVNDSAVTRPFATTSKEGI